MSDDLRELVLDHCEQLVVFELAGESYGVDIGAVNTIIRMQEITAIPRSEDYVEGVINLRGSIIPIIELRKRFGLPSGKTTKASRIVVVEAGGQMIGLVVDAVAETLRLPTEAIEGPSTVVAGVDSAFIRGIGKTDNRLIILLDVEKTLSLAEAGPKKRKSKSAEQDINELTPKAA